MASDGVEIAGPKGDRFNKIITPEATAWSPRCTGSWAGAARNSSAARAKHSSRSSRPGGHWTSWPRPSRSGIAPNGGWPRPPRAWWTGGSRSPAQLTGSSHQRTELSARVWLADFEDANTPLWENIVSGQLNLIGALNQTLDFTSEEGKSYQLAARTRTWPPSWSGHAAGT